MFFYSARYPATELHSSAVERVHEYIRNASRQHRVQQFFTEDKINTKLDELHTVLGASYTVRNRISFAPDQL
jgi:hypothetical protein